MKLADETVYCRRKNQPHLPTDFTGIIAHVENFLRPVADAVRSGQPFSKRWIKPKILS